MIYQCFGCHTVLGEDEANGWNPTNSQVSGLCDDCAPHGQAKAVTRRPTPCPCGHCTYWRTRSPT